MSPPVTRQSRVQFPNGDGDVGDLLGFPGIPNNEESASNAGDPGLIPGLGRSPEGGNDYPLQYSSLEKSMDRGT